MSPLSETWICNPAAAGTLNFHWKRAFSFVFLKERGARKNLPIFSCSRSLLGQPVPVRHHLLGEKLPPNIRPKPPLSQIKTIPPCPITVHPRKQPFPLLFIRSLQVLEGRNEVSPEPSLLQAKQAQFPQPFFMFVWRTSHSPKRTAMADGKQEKKETEIVKYQGFIVYIYT